MLAVVLFCLMVIKVLVKNQHFQNSAKYKTTNLSIKTKCATNIEEYMGGVDRMVFVVHTFISFSKRATSSAGHTARNEYTRSQVEI
jgi:hypothetical protein